MNKSTGNDKKSDQIQELSIKIPSMLAKRVEDYANLATPSKDFNVYMEAIGNKCKVYL